MIFHLNMRATAGLLITQSSTELAAILQNPTEDGMQLHSRWAGWSLLGQAICLHAGHFASFGSG